MRHEPADNEQKRKISKKIAKKYPNRQAGEEFKV